MGKSLAPFECAEPASSILTCHQPFKRSQRCIGVHPPIPTDNMRLYTLQYSTMGDANSITGNCSQIESVAILSPPTSLA